MIFPCINILFTNTSMRPMASRNAFSGNNAMFIAGNARLVHDSAAFIGDSAEFICNKAEFIAGNAASSLTNAALFRSNACIIPNNASTITGSAVACSTHNIFSYQDRNIAKQKRVAIIKENSPQKKETTGFIYQ